ncbi:MAG TPA: Hsp20/alpha crystallin family protein [Kofleriaceae bacterium]|jgi:HSP20 family protein|nr:Hsp20/alpha crystallin family protein [Kofleriaceae bacterium]
MQTYFWNPWSIFDELERPLLSASSTMWPQFDIEDMEDATVMTADLPGMTEDDVEITVSGSHLVVRGERKPKDGKFVRRARFHGTFERRFSLGDAYDPDGVSAALEHGVLTIRLAKAAKAKPRRIKLGGGLASKMKGLLGGEREPKAA